MLISGIDVAGMAFVMSALILAIGRIVRRQDQRDRCHRCCNTVHKILGGRP